MVRMNAFLTRETQDFASPLKLAEGLGIGMTMASASRDAKFCVSRAKNAVIKAISSPESGAILASPEQQTA